MFDTLKRRTFLQAVVAVAASTTFGCSDEDTPTDQGTRYFPQSLCSGDPRPDSVVLWVRAVDPDRAGADLTVRLEVSTRDDFSALVLDKKDLTARAATDNTLSVKVTNLSARTTYYYRFTYEKDGKRYTTNTGRTKTAPAAGDDVAVKFAFASCQDFIGRYYNTWQRLVQLNEDLDFVVFLGDYIYETTGDQSFQSGAGRSVIFSDPASALPQGSGVTAFLAANSVSNYRDLYKTFRSDKQLQAVHERYPFIIVWDDHEFSDDSWGSHATYEDGKTDENSEARKRNSEQAFFEYIPLDLSTGNEGAIDVGAIPRYPDTHIYRSFDYGRNVKLMVLDYRTFRPDHIIPEDAYPASVAVDQAMLTAVLASQPDPVKQAFQADTFAYVNIDDAGYAQQKTVLQQAYVAQAQKAGLSRDAAAEKAATWVKGNVSLFYANQVLQQVGASALMVSPSGKPRGVAFVHMGKSSLFNIQGSRYVVVKDTFDLYSAVKFQASQGASENVLGTAQETWFQQTVREASQTWKIVVSSTSLSSLIWDLRDKTDVADPTLRQRFYFCADQWDGFPTKKKMLLSGLKQNVNNALFISGDIHASFASVEEGVPTLTTPAITSSSIKGLAGLAVMAAGYSEGSSVYRYVITEMEKTLQSANPNLRFAEGDANGFVVLEVKADEALATFHLIPGSEVGKDYSKRSAEELATKAFSKTFRVKAGDIQAL
ncbi:alkaline phosphatase D family protein [Myxococcaceae bacterium JPH2]|nr:alkaline phosphatase D family protein [Myxococcaceae bacterium JPH2]